MVIGTGMIATEFKKYMPDGNFVIFASGVSDSTHAAAEAYLREKTLLEETINSYNDKILVYFGTCSIYDPSMKESPYVHHKIKMEDMIIRNQKKYMIFRLSNVVGFTGNQNTVINYFVRKIISNQPFELWQHATRNVIDISDMYKACDEILQKGLYTNTIINIANPFNYKVVDIIEAIESHFNIKGNYQLKPKGSGPIIDTSAVEGIFRELNITFGPKYLSVLLNKYFPLQ